MKIQKQLDEALKQDMDRKEFFSYVGVVLLAVFGVSNLMKAIDPTQGTKLRAQHSKGYSGGPYGR